MSFPQRLASSTMSPSSSGQTLLYEFVFSITRLYPFIRIFQRRVFFIRKVVGDHFIIRSHTATEVVHPTFRDSSTIIGLKAESKWPGTMTLYHGSRKLNRLIHVPLGNFKRILLREKGAGRKDANTMNSLFDVSGRQNTLGPQQCLIALFSFFQCMHRVDE